MGLLDTLKKSLSVTSKQLVDQGKQALSDKVENLNKSIQEVPNKILKNISNGSSGSTHTISKDLKSNSSFKFTLNIPSEDELIEEARQYRYHILEENLPVGDIILLNWCNNSSHSNFPRYFLFDYGINADSEVKKLLSLNYLRYATPFEILEKKTMVELKSILSIKDLKSSRAKAETIEKIKENFSEDELTPYTVNNKIYKVTDSGKVLLEKYKNIIWGHENNSKDGLVNAFTFEENLTTDPVELAVHILENDCTKNIMNGDFGLAYSNLRQISDYKKGDFNSLLSSFCIEISGLQNGEIVSWYDEFPEYLGKSLRALIAQNELSDLEIENRANNIWQNLSPLFPVSIVNDSKTAITLLFYLINDKRTAYKTTMKELYKKVPESYKYDSWRDN